MPSVVSAPPAVGAHVSVFGAAGVSVDAALPGASGVVVQVPAVSAAAVESPVVAVAVIEGSAANVLSAATGSASASPLPGARPASIMAITIAVVPARSHMEDSDPTESAQMRCSR